jgi:hypothetical protein
VVWSTRTYAGSSKLALAPLAAAVLASHDSRLAKARNRYLWRVSYHILVFDGYLGSRNAARPRPRLGELQVQTRTRTTDSDSLVFDRRDGTVRGAVRGRGKGGGGERMTKTGPGTLKAHRRGRLRSRARSSRLAKTKTKTAPRLSTAAPIDGDRDSRLSTLINEDRGSELVPLGSRRSARLSSRLSTLDSHRRRPRLGARGSARET